MRPLRKEDDVKKRRKRSGLVNLNAITRLARKAYENDDLTAREVRMSWLHERPWCVSTGMDMTLMHVDRTVVRKMAKAALEAAIRATAPRKRPNK